MAVDVLPEWDLSGEELEVALKALGLYQIHLFDEMSGEQKKDTKMIESDVRNTTSCIKKLHKILETRAKKHV